MPQVLVLLHEHGFQGHEAAFGALVDYGALEEQDFGGIDFGLHALVGYVFGEDDAADEAGVAAGTPGEFLEFDVVADVQVFGVVVFV